MVVFTKGNALKKYITLKLNCYSTYKIELRETVAKKKKKKPFQRKSIRYQLFSVFMVRCLGIRHDSYFVERTGENYLPDHSMLS